MQIGDTTCESISKTAQSSASCSDLRASAASGYLCTFPRWVPISEEAQTSSSWRFDAYAGGKRGLACYLARTWIRTLKLRPHSGSETATLGFNLHVEARKEASSSIFLPGTTQRCIASGTCQVASEAKRSQNTAGGKNEKNVNDIARSFRSYPSSFLSR